MAQTPEPQSGPQEGSTGSLVPFPVVRTVTYADVRGALNAGTQDFLRAPFFGLAFGAFYVAAGAIIVLGLSGAGLAYLVFPALAGFMLVGPVTVVGLYEVSRRLERGEPLTLGGIFSGMARPGRFNLLAFGFALTFLLFVWLRIAALIYALSFGLKALPMADLLTAIFTTQTGFVFLLVGNGAGALIATFVFSVSVVSVPFVLDKGVDFMTAIIASLIAVRRSPGPMLLWGLIITGMVVLSGLTAFLALAAVLPIIGHATWHLYRRTLEHPAG